MGKKSEVPSRQYTDEFKIEMLRLVESIGGYLIRNCLEFADYKDRKSVAAALRLICAAANETAALEALQAFATAPWGQKYPTITQSWQRA